MNFSQGTRGIVRALAIVLSVALPLAVAISEADARVGGGAALQERVDQMLRVVADAGPVGRAGRDFNG